MFFLGFMAEIRKPKRNLKNFWFVMEFQEFTEILWRDFLNYFKGFQINLSYFFFGNLPKK